MYRIYGKSDIGLVRKYNEDAFMVDDTVVCTGGYYKEIEDDNFIAAVADGIGGMSFGNVASRLCLEELAKETPTDAQELERQIMHIHQSIVRYGAEYNRSFDAGTTLIGMLAKDKNICLFHVGDSRIYRFTRGNLEQLTKDDSLVLEMYETGYITREEMFDHPLSDILTQSLGASKELDIHIDQYEDEIEKGDIFFMCSDGLSDFVDFNRLESILYEGKNIVSTVDNFIEEAKNQGGHENITVVGIEKI